ncbi:hypothetical protein PHMEG_00038387 [Phytophthora megakarya]|uniref:RxLR effector protein n=1 Tax=Phytophthora megakarya TaxID=4795 RepID=A0A225UHQ4_9STRA|nr:hypothetical protein PHMEG_00038387 [Phytophthora megakarya]
MITLGMMLKDVEFKQKMFKIWDKVPLPEIMHKLGASNLKDKKVAEMVTEYVQRLNRQTP